MKKQSDEEKEHAMKIYGYLFSRLDNVELDALQKGKTYQFEIKAMNSGYYENQETGSFEVPIDSAIPQTPQNLQTYSLPEFEKTILLKWGLEEDEHVDGFKIYKSSDGIDFEQVCEVESLDVDNEG